MITPLDAFQILPVDRRKHDTFEIHRRMRVNSLCSLWYFGKAILHRDQLNAGIHLTLCQQMQQRAFKDVFEVARGHLKSTIGSEMLPIWRTLNFTDDDADYILNLKGEDGRPLYNNAFCQYLTQVHNPNTTWLLISETEPLAIGLLQRIKLHYEENSDFRSLFNALLPASCMRVGNRLRGAWGSKQLVINRPERTIPEPTFECRGAAQPVQSKHVTGAVIEDDTIGEKSLGSLQETNKRIGTHTRLAGVFSDEDKDHAGSQLVIGNRWSLMDLNSHIRANEPWFSIHSLGCLWCDLCKTDTIIDLTTFKTFETNGELLCLQGHPTRPVFPEQFTLRKIHQIWKQLSSKGKEIDFTAQYLNAPGISSDSIFQTPWLQYYSLIEDPLSGKPVAVWFQNEARKFESARVESMNRYMTLDPSYGSDSPSACRNGIAITGVDECNRKFILEAWGRVCGLEQTEIAVNAFADKWGLDYCYVEDAGGGRIVGQAINQRNQMLPHPLRAKPIVYKKKEEFRRWIQASQTPITAQKLARIIGSLQSVFEGKQVWIRGDLHEQKNSEGAVVSYSWTPHRDATDLLTEYKGFVIGNDGNLLPGTYVDILDALANHPQLWQTPATYEDLMILDEHRQRYLEAGR